jgi:hypothetical protein
LAVTSIVGFAIAAAAPCFLSLYFRKRVWKFKDEGFRLRFKDAIDILTDRHTFSAFYFSLFCYRRLVLMVIIVYV